MTVLLRQYLQTLVLFAAGIFLAWPLWLTFSGIFTAAITDFCLVSRSGELSLYRQGSDPEDATSPPKGPGQAACWQIAGAIVSAAVPLAAAGAGADVSWQGIANAMALLVAGSIGSFCGFRAVRPLHVARRDMLGRLESLPDALFVVNILPRRASRLVGAIARIALGAILMLPFLALLKNISTVPLNIPLVLIQVGLAIFFQLGFVLLSQALFSLRWWRGAGADRETMIN